jgi:hypothetical protein
MIALDVLYVALATIGIMALLQVLTFIMVRVLYPPEPKIIYRDAPQQVQAPVQAPLFTPVVNYELPILPLVSQTQPQVPVLTETKQEVQLPDYDVRKSVSTSARLDSVLPDGIQETRPPGT